MLDHDAAIAKESERFADAVRQGEPDAPVPTCPEWDLQDLAWHLTEVHAYWARILAAEPRDEEEAELVEGSKPDRPGTVETILEVFDEETESLLDELSTRPDDDYAWFWLDTSQTVGAIRRMQAHEATIHRIDAELAAGIEPEPIPSETAMDGVRHAFEVMWAWWGTVPGIRFEPLEGLVELVASDGGSVLVELGRWRGTTGSGRQYDLPAARLATEGKPAATVSGSAEQLMRWLWGRGDEPATDGDPEALTALRGVRDEGMQ